MVRTNKYSVPSFEESDLLDDEAVVAGLRGGIGLVVGGVRSGNLWRFVGDLDCCESRCDVEGGGPSALRALAAFKTPYCMFFG